MRRLGILVILLVMATGCAPSGIHVEGAEALPAATAEDWVTYADHLVPIHIESEHRVPPSDEEVEAGEGVTYPTAATGTMTQRYRS